MRPPAIDPQTFPALEQLRQCCTQGGDKLIDRVYAEALSIHRMLREKENELENAWAALDFSRSDNTTSYTITSDAAGSDGEDLL